MKYLNNFNILIIPYPAYVFKMGMSSRNIATEMFNGRKIRSLIIYMEYIYIENTET